MEYDGHGMMHVWESVISFPVSSGMFALGLVFRRSSSERLHLPGSERSDLCQFTISMEQFGE